MTHTRKLLAAAVAGALAAPAGVALAQTSTVQIGGQQNVLYYHHKPNNANVGKKGDVLVNSEPNLFIQGEENLGGGLRAWFRCESTMDAIGGVATATGFCTRNSAVGFRGNFGNFFLGNWDSPSKDAFNRVRGWWGGTAAFLGVAGNLLFNATSSGLNNPPPGTATSAQSAAFWRRNARSVNYHSPVWNGFQVKGQFTSATETTGIPEANPLKPRLWAASGQYSAGPLVVALGYERHIDYNPANAVIGGGAAQYSGGDDNMWVLGASYTFGPARLAAIYTRSEYDVTNTTDLKHAAWGVYGDYSLGGPHTLRAHYVKMRDTKGSATGAASRVHNFVANGGAGGTGADTWGVAYSYAFSKRTIVSALYRKVDNGANTSRFGVGATAATVGGSQSAYGINIRHRY